MKAKRLLFLVIAICLASGVKAQFYDSADDIYYYVEYKDGRFVDNGNVFIFNFDGRKACLLGESVVNFVKNKFKEDADYFDRRVETSEYSLEYTHSSYYTVYQGEKSNSSYSPTVGSTTVTNSTFRYEFSTDRETMYDKSYVVNTYYYPFEPYKKTYKTEQNKTYKRVDKSFFKVGRSRTPSSTMHE